MYTKPKINTLIGNKKEELPQLLTDNQEEIQTIKRREQAAWQGCRQQAAHIFDRDHIGAESQHLFRLVHKICIDEH